MAKGKAQERRAQKRGGAEIIPLTPEEQRIYEQQKRGILEQIERARKNIIDEYGATRSRMASC